MESTLAITFAELKARITSFMGWGRGSDYGDTPLTSDQSFQLQGLLASGLRQFYYPPPLEGERVSHDWSFLRPTCTLTLALGDSTLALPDDFGGFEGRITLVPSATQTWTPIDLFNEGLVRQRAVQLPAATGIPEMAALVWLKGTTASAGQRAQLLFWPQADKDYPINFQYYVLPDYLQTAFPYHLGGMAHAETILESCLATAEQRLDDSATVHSLKFKERLAASINIDRKMKPQRLGYNGDNSDALAARCGNLHWNFPGITFQGVLYALAFMGVLCTQATS